MIVGVFTYAHARSTFCTLASSANVPVTAPSRTSTSAKLQEHTCLGFRDWPEVAPESFSRLALVSAI